MSRRRSHAIVWAAAASRDLLAIVKYLRRDSPGAAARVAGRILDAAQRLSALPGRGRVVPELEAHGLTLYREVIERPWRIVYRSSGGTVSIVAVVDGRRNVEDVLLERLVR